MHLRLSEDELATLIDMVSLAAEISSLNQKPGTEELLASFEALEDKVLEKAKPTFRIVLMRCGTRSSGMNSLFASASVI